MRFCQVLQGGSLEEVEKLHTELLADLYAIQVGVCGRGVAVPCWLTASSVACAQIAPALPGWRQSSRTCTQLHELQLQLGICVPQCRASNPPLPAPPPMLCSSIWPSLRHRWVGGVGWIRVWGGRGAWDGRAVGCVVNAA